MDSRATEIQQLRTALNEKHNTQLTDEQIENWVGSDTPTAHIPDLYHEVKNNDPMALTPEDVLSLWVEIEG